LIVLSFVFGTTLAASSAGAQAVSNIELQQALVRAHVATASVDDWDYDGWFPTPDERHEFCGILDDAAKKLDELEDLYDRAIAAGQKLLAKQIDQAADDLSDAIDDGDYDIDCFPPFFGFLRGPEAGLPLGGGHLYVELEAGGGQIGNTFNVTPGFGVSSNGFLGGGAVGIRWPTDLLNGPPLELVGVRFGVLGSNFNGSFLYPTDGSRYSVKMPLVFFGEAELGSPMINSAINAFLPNSGIRVYSSLGLAGIVQTYGWTMPAVGSTTTTNIGFTSGIRAEFPVLPHLDMFVEWRTILATPQSVGIPGQVPITGGLSNIGTAGLHYGF
jgi:hypothetical protein